MVNLKINGQPLAVAEGTTIMEAARLAGVEIPHLCYLKEINEIGACRVCMVELAGYSRMVTACNTQCQEDMDILTSSPRVRRNRKINVELILSDHRSECTSCIRSGNCSLQTVAADLGMFDRTYENIADVFRWEKNLPLIKDASRCVKCMRCIQICDKIQTMNVWDLQSFGYRTTVGTSGSRKFSESDCVLCGQCITHCPVGALTAREDRGILNEALADPDVVTMVQIAPAVRTAWGEGIGMKGEEASMGRLVHALKRIGIDYVFDTSYSADLTIMEEGSELLERLAHKEDHSWPMFTSCCPGWIRFVKTRYPELIPKLSTAKSPQQMFGAMAKTYIAENLNIDPKKIFSVSIMPCVSKKYECSVKAVNDSGCGRDVDLVLTTREIDRFIRADAISPETLHEAPYDGIFGEGSGAAVIFGTTGGVMEAALRTAYFLATGENTEPDAFRDVRGSEGWKEASFRLADTNLRVAAVSGLGNARRLIEAVKRGEADYDFVEVMACPGGCTGGGGQPFRDGMEAAEVRGKKLYSLDSESRVRFSHENSAVQRTYREYLGHPLSHKAHKLLHTDLSQWELRMTDTERK